MKRKGMLAAVLLIAAVFAAMPAEASLHQETAYASYNAKWVYVDSGWHVALGYKIPHDTLQFPLPGNDLCRSPCYRPYVGGVNNWVAGNLPDHKNPQQWDYNSRVQIDANWDKLELMIPKTYVVSMYAINNYNWQREIYIKYFRR